MLTRPTREARRILLRGLWLPLVVGGWAGVDPASEPRPVAAGEISGRVRDAESGEPLAGVSIFLESLESKRGWWKQRVLRDTSSDSAGLFALRSIQRGRYRLRAQQAGYGMAIAEVRVGPTPSPSVDLALGPPQELVLRFAHEDGSKVDEVYVARLDPDGRWELGSTEVADAQGRIRVGSGPAGLWRELWAHSRDSAWQRIEVEPATEEAPVQLTAAASLAFTVSELADAPAEVLVSLRDAAGRALAGREDTEEFLSRHGRGWAGNLWPGIWTLDVRHTDGRAWRATFTAWAGETTEVDLLPEHSTRIDWPESGICLRGRSASDEPCRTLLPGDGLAIQRALEAYVRSEGAVHNHSNADLDGVRRYVGPPRLVRLGGRELPKIGDFFIYQGDSDAALELENTVAVGLDEQGRRGFSFSLHHDGETWAVTAFDSWRAWR